MELERRALKIGAAAIICAILLRLAGNLPTDIKSFLTGPDLTRMAILLHTGRLVRLPEEVAIPDVSTPEVTEPTGDAQGSATPMEAAVAVFGQEDASLVSVNSYCGYDADLPTLLQTPLSWDLTETEPTVLILHSHGSESYVNSEGYTESSPHRTLDENYNVVSVGERLAQCLEAGGIRVIHDTTLHDQPSYNDSYGSARESIRQYLSQYPEICLVLDIHRDAVELSDGSQKKYTVTTPQGEAAQLMLVVGTDAGGLDHPDWPSNMALAVKLHAQLEKTAPGSCRPISFRSQRFNQDLSPGALIVEVGAAGNTRQEALLGAELLAQAILAMAGGTVTSQ